MTREDWRILLIALSAILLAAYVLLTIRTVSSPRFWIIPPAAAQDLEDRGAWFKSLKQNGTGTSCCDVSDCRAVDADQDPKTSQWFVTIRPEDRVSPQLAGKTIPVPPEKVLDKLSVDGDAYLCSAPVGTIYCFVPPSRGM